LKEPKWQFDATNIHKYEKKN